MTEKKLKLYAWKWVGGGRNQTYAFTKGEARKKGNGMAPGTLVIEEGSFHRVRNEKKFWDKFPIFSD